MPVAVATPSPTSDTTSSSTAFDEVIDYSQYSYKRVNHFFRGRSVRASARRRTACRTTSSSRSCTSSTRRTTCTDPNDITQKRVRDVLRKLRLRKAYDHVAQITARLSGNPPLRIPLATEEQLRNMFLRMQPAFARHAPKTRTNFLPSVRSVSLLPDLGLHHMCDGIALLKGRDKLEANDAIFRKMSVDLGWPVFELPPVAA